MPKAVIYCRVSSDKQATQGHGLSSQESSCRHYARDEGFEVVAVFKDDYSGGGDFWKRPGIAELLAFLEKQDEEIAVIFDDLKRFARDTFFHLKLRQELSVRNAFPRCPNFRFDDTPEGEYIETIIAATAELERKQNRRQVISRMRARFEAGYWLFHPPVGYRYERVDGAKQLVLDPSSGPVVRRVLKDFAAGNLPSQEAARRILLAKGIEISKQAMKAFLCNPLYAGWCVCKKWNLRVQGKHQPLISAAELRQIEERLAPRKVQPQLYRRVRAEFPLRGFMQCTSCGRLFTGVWTQGRSEKYPYYRCMTKRCLGSLGTAQVEKRFHERLQEARPRSTILTLFERVVRAEFGERTNVQAAQKKARREQVRQVEDEIANLVDACAATKSARVRESYEEKIEALHRQKEALEAPLPDTSADELEPVLEVGYEILKDPAKSWLAGNVQRRRLVQSLAFEGPIPYRRDSGFGTAEFSLLFSLLRKAKGDESSLVELFKNRIHPAAAEFKRWKILLNEYRANQDDAERDGESSHQD